MVIGFSAKSLPVPMAIRLHFLWPPPILSRVDLAHSFARPAKLFTAHQSKVIRVVGKLNLASYSKLIQVIIDLLRP
jgi:hypothetical protein